jgi:hypothetical protein
MSNRRLVVPGVAVAATLMVAPASRAQGFVEAFGREWDVNSSIATELRTFPVAPQYADQADRYWQPSTQFQTEIVTEFGDGDYRLTITPYVRLDAIDSARTHADLRALNVLRFGDGWDAVAGIDKVFWGVTESVHLVDIINQTDNVEDIDGEDKLGQPMLNLNFYPEWGTVNLFALPYFRERSFTDAESRLRGPIAVDRHKATYDSPMNQGHPDFAARFSRVFGDVDVGISHFHGTSREPRFQYDVARNVLVPHYDIIDQTGLDVQYTTDAWLWKFEGIGRGGHGDYFFAGVGGFEYTMYQILDRDWDLGLLTELQWDGRDLDDAPGVVSDNDIFLGSRLALNDTQDSEFLAGGSLDWETGAISFGLEAARRLGDDWSVEVESRLNFDVPSDDLASGFRSDDFIAVRLTRYF